MITVEDTGLDEGVQPRNCKISVSAGFSRLMFVVVQFGGGEEKSSSFARRTAEGRLSPHEPGSPHESDSGHGAEGGVLDDSAHELEGLGRLGGAGDLVARCIHQAFLNRVESEA